MREASARGGGLPPRAGIDTRGAKEIGRGDSPASGSRSRARVGCFGVTSLDAPVPVDEHTLFQIGSTTKTFTASAVMRLVEKGKLDLDAPVRRYVPELRLRDPDVRRRVTLRHLLTHTGGWHGDYFKETGRGDDALSSAVARLHETPQLTPLGNVWHYNNAGFTVAGRAIERVTRKTYEQAIAELILEPLEMRASFFLAEDVISHRASVGHIWRKGTQHAVARPWAFPRMVGPAGALCSSVLDQLRWARFCLGDGRAPSGKRLLRARTIRLMQTPQVSAGSMAAAPAP